MYNHGRLFYYIDKLGRNIDLFLERLKMFCYKHSNFLTWLFLVVYTLEQILLLILTVIFEGHIKIIISFFIALTFLTFNTQKLFIESKGKHLERSVSELEFHNNYLMSEVESLTRTIDKIHSSYEKLSSKSLKETKPNNNLGKERGAK